MKTQNAARLVIKRALSPFAPFTMMAAKQNQTRPDQTRPK